MLASFIESEDGATAIEYGLIAALIAVTHAQGQAPAPAPAAAPAPAQTPAQAVAAAPVKGATTGFMHAIHATNNVETTLDTTSSWLQETATCGDEHRCAARTERSAQGQNLGSEDLSAQRVTPPHNCS